MMYAGVGLACKNRGNTHSENRWDSSERGMAQLERLGL